MAPQIEDLYGKVNFTGILNPSKLAISQMINCYVWNVINVIALLIVT